MLEQSYNLIFLSSFCSNFYDEVFPIFRCLNFMIIFEPSSLSPLIESSFQFLQNLYKPLLKHNKNEILSFPSSVLKIASQKLS